jgi:hypothetical protein
MIARCVFSIVVCSFLTACSGTADPEDYVADTKIYGPEVNQPLNIEMVYKFDLEPKQEVTINCNLDTSKKNVILVYWTNEKGTNLPVALSCNSSTPSPVSFEHKNTTDRIIHFLVSGWDRKCTEVEEKNRKKSDKGEANTQQDTGKYVCQWNQSKPNSVSQELEAGVTEHTVIEFHTEKVSSGEKSSAEVIIKK